MIHSPKNRGRRGEIACRCCERPVRSRTARTREARAWKQEAGL